MRPRRRRLARNRRQARARARVIASFPKGPEVDDLLAALAAGSGDRPPPGFVLDPGPWLDFMGKITSAIYGGVPVDADGGADER